MGVPDAIIQSASLQVTGPESRPVHDAQGTSFRIDGLGTFRVEEGKRILVDGDWSQDPRNIRLYILGTALGLLLLQRGDVPLHANAISVGDRAIAVAGPSGAGKSTLAAIAVERGLRLLTDDVAVIRIEDGSARVSPGIPRLRLWRDTLEARGHRADGLARAYVSDAPWDKYDLPVADQGQSDVPLSGIFILDRGDRLAIEPLSGMEAARTLMENVYRGDWAGDAIAQGRIFDWATRLCRTVPIRRLVRPWNLLRAGEALELILDAASQLETRLNAD